MSNLHRQTLDRLKELGVKPDRTLGQNFLVSESVVQKIIQAVEKLNPQHLIEVGPGLGALTEKLIPMNIPIQLVELDRDFAKYWRERGLGVVEDDALHVDWQKLSLPADTVFISNLPYQISTHIVVERCLGPLQIKGMVLMFQKEVAERLTSAPRNSDYGFLSVISQTYFKMTRLLEAGPKDFWPAPKVASQVLVFERIESPVGEGERALKFLKFLKASFSHRRKYLSKNLLSTPLSRGMTSESIQKEFQEMNINPKARAEELSVEQFQKLFLRWS